MYCTIKGKREFLSEILGYQDVLEMNDTEVIIACCHHYREMYDEEEALERRLEHARHLDKRREPYTPKRHKKTKARKDGLFISEEMRKKIHDCPYVCYFFYGANDEILYVGKANNFFMRWREHRKLKDTEKIYRIELRVFKALPDVLFYETQMILTHNPVWNVKDKKGEMSNVVISPEYILDIDMGKSL